MKTICRTRRLICAVLVLVALFLTTRAGASAGDSYQSYSQGKLIAHLPMPGGGARQMFLRHQGKVQYLYVQRSSQQGFTVIDVTKPERPKLVRRVPIETVTVMGSGLVVTETPDKSATTSYPPGNVQGARGDDTVPESVRVLDVSNPAHPQTMRTSGGVTSVLADDARGLIYVVNSEGIWILSPQPMLRRHQCSSSDAISNLPNCD